MSEILGYALPKTCIVLYLGNLTQDIIRGEDKYLVMVLLAASKKAVTRLWNKPNPPTQKQWLGIVEEIYEMEKLTHILRIQEVLFDVKWEKWLEYRAGQNDPTH